MSEASERGHYPRFLHLMEVTIYSATGQTTTMEDLLWRIHIDKIDGFSMGTLNQAEEERVA